MYTLKRYSIPCPENDKDLFLFLYWDTEGHDPSGWEVFTRNKTYERDRMWLGYVDRDNQEFDIRNAQAGLLKNRLSRFRIKGRVKRGIVSKTLEVEIGFDWSLAVEALIPVTVLTAVMMTKDLMISLAVWLVLMLLLLLLYDDFNDSEELILKYLKDPVKVSKLVIRK